MSAKELLNSLQQIGVTITVEADDLEIDVPRDVLTDEWLQAIRANKAELIYLLSSPKAASTDQREGRKCEKKDEKIRCYRCDGG